MPSDESVTDVLVMFKCHLDVGFTDTEANVVRRYCDVHLPQAIDVAEAVRAESEDRYVWTVPAWLLYRFLEHADPRARRRAEKAIGRGDLAWHALPFTWYTELLDRGSIAAALGFSARLDARFGTETTAARLTDVPGHTRGLIGPLAEAGVTFLDIGVNPGCRAPRVPAAGGLAVLPSSEDDTPDPDLITWHDAEPVHADQGTPEAERQRLIIEGINSPETHLFRWLDPEGQEVSVLYHRTCYGSTVRLPSIPVALSMRVHGDNLGPHSVESVRHAYTSLRRKFPSARVRAASLSEIGRIVDEIRADLPVLTSEIGDTWIYGTGSDPAKTSTLREVLRLRSEWVADGGLEAGGDLDLRLLGELIPAPEHNWGLSTSMYLRSWTGYRTDELARSRAADDVYIHNDTEWDSKRRAPERAVGVLPPDLRIDAERRLAGLSDAPPRRGTGSAETYTLQNDCVHATISRASGAIAELTDRRTGRQWSAGEGLAVFAYQAFDTEDYRRYADQYNYAAFTANDFGKPGLAAYPVTSLLWRPAGTISYTDGDAVVVEVQPPPQADDPERLSAWPERLVLRYCPIPSTAGLDITCWVMGKKANRRPEALWLSFAVNGNDPGGWRLDKLGQSVDPHDVVSGGGRYLHGVGSGARYGDAAGGFQLIMLDAHLVSPGGRNLLRFDDEPLDLSGGMHVNLYNNLWGTAFPQWYDRDMRFRFQIVLHTPDEARP